MGLAGTIVRRSLFGAPGRTLFSILGIAVGIATVVAVFTVDHVTVLSRTLALQPDWGADLEVRPSEVLDDPRETLLQMEGVAGVAAFFQNDVRVSRLGADSAGEDGGIAARVIALEASAADSLGVYYVEEGRGIDPEAPGGQVLLGRGLAEDLGVRVGDSVVLAPPGNAARKACVDGEFRMLGAAGDTGVAARPQPFRVTGILAREGLGRRGNGRMCVLDYEVGRRLLSDVFIESQFWLKRHTAVDLDDLETKLSKSFSFERNQRAAVGQMADERAFRNGVRLAGLFALLLGLFVIFHTLSMSLFERVREVGALSALGATRAQIAGVFLSEALVIALFGGALGLGGGIALGWALLSRGISTLGVVGGAIGPFEVPWRSVLGLTSLGVAIALLGSIYPIVRARDTDVVAALRGEESGRRASARGFHVFLTLLLTGVVPIGFFAVVPIVGAAESRLVGTVLIGLFVLGLLLGAPFLAPGLFGRLAGLFTRPLERFFPLAAKLAGRSLEVSPTRMGASVAAIALVTSAFVGLKGMTNSLVGEIEVWGDEAMAGKVWVEGLPNIDYETLRARLHEAPEVIGVDPGDVRAMLSFLLLGLPSQELVAYGPMAEDATLLTQMREAQGMVVSRRLARQRGLAVGDPVLVQTSGHGVVEFRVAAVTDAYGYFRHPDERAYGVIDASAMERYFCLTPKKTTKIAVRLDGEGDVELVRALLHEHFPKTRQMPLKFYDGPRTEAILLADIRRDFVLFDIILFLTALLAGLGVLNGQLLAALERRKELGVLRALGMTRGQVAGAVLLESALVGLLGGALGLIVGSGLTPVLVSALRVLSDLPLPMRGAGPFLALSLLGALALAIVAGLYPIWRMNRLDAVRAVRTG